MTRDILLYVEDILQAIELVKKSTRGITWEDFSKNRDIQDATIRRLEIIGECVKNIPQEVKNKYSDIEWKKIAGMRDVLIHAYFDVHGELVWNVVQNDLSSLEKKIKQIKSELE